MAKIITEWPYFFTATILEWKQLLRPDKYKDIITDGFRFIVEDERVKIYSFVIMSNHIHLIWRPYSGINRKAVQRDFLKVAAQKIKADLRRYHPNVLQCFKVGASDREYQIWERNPLSIELRSHKVFRQKLNYIHQNPVKAGICKWPEEYKYSSAQFYNSGIDNWGFLTHYND